jgi:hypothetical protein
LYNSIPNVVRNHNDTFEYSPDNGTTWKNIVLTTGAYELDAISKEIAKAMIDKGDYDRRENGPYIRLSVNRSHFTSIITISHPTYKVRFTSEHTIGTILGFEGYTDIISQGITESPNIVNIMETQVILVHMDCITETYRNSQMAQILYSFSPNVPPGCLMIKEPTQTQPKTISVRNFQSIRIWLTDQDNKPLITRGEKITICCNFNQHDNTIIKLLRDIKHHNERHDDEDY